MKNLKEFIIDEYKRRRSPISIESFCGQYEQELSQANCELSEMPPLDNMFNLTPEQASELFEYYGEGFLFSQEIEKNIHEYSITRKNLDIIENKKNK